jgi:predicted exporter
MSGRRSLQRRPGLPAFVRSPRERQELLVAHGIVAALQLAIAAALAVSALQTYRMWRQGIPYIPGEIARTVPLFLSVGMLLALFAASRSVLRVRAIRQLPLEAPPEP